MNSLLRILLGCLALVAALSVLPFELWWLEYYRHFLLQMLPMVWLAFLWTLYRRQPRAAFAFFGLGVWQLTLMMTALTGPTSVGTSEQDFKILSANVLTSNTEYQRLLDLIAEENPDILMLMEVNQRWLQELEPIRESYPYGLASTREDNFGILLWSRLPMEANAANFVRDSPPHIMAEVLGETPFFLCAMHPIPPISKVAIAERNAHLSHAAEILEAQPGPGLLVGDFNATPWSSILAKVRKTAKLHSASSWPVPTWPTFLPPMAIPIDHMLVREGIEVVDCRRGAAIGSDHWPLLMTFRVAPKAEALAPR